MNSVSVTAKVIAVLKLSAKVLGYIKDVKDAPQSYAQYATRTSDLYNLLSNLSIRIQEGDPTKPWYTAVQALAVKDGPLDHVIEALEALGTMMTDRTQPKIPREVLLWKFREEDAARILDCIERLKSLVEIALQMDHFKLSQAIKDDTNLVQTHLPVIQTTVDNIHQDQDSSRHGRLRDWNSSSAYTAQHSDILERRQEETGEWFLNETAGELERQWKGEENWEAIIERRRRGGRCFNCGSNMHWENECQDNCGLRPGHQASKCSNLVRCKNCRGQGHIAKDCPNPRRMQDFQRSLEGIHGVPRTPETLNEPYRISQAGNSANPDQEDIPSLPGTYAPAGLNRKTSIVDLCKFLGLPADIRSRDLLAEKLRIDVGSTGSSERNIALHKALMKECALNNGKLPSNICSCDECGRSGHWAYHCPDVLGQPCSEALKKTVCQSKGDCTSENNVLSSIEDVQRLLNTPELRHTSTEEPGEEDLDMLYPSNVDDAPSKCAKESDCSDDSWAPESIFSVDMQSNSPRSSFSSTVRIPATEGFADLLIADNEIRSLCVIGITDRNVGPARLERNLRRLLYRYAKDLGEEAVSPAQFAAVKLLQSRFCLQRIANKVRRTVGDESNSLDIGEEPLGPGENIQSYLKSMSRLHENVLEQRSAESSSSDDDQEGKIDEPQDFSLQSLAAFLCNSRAFELLKQNLQDFVFSTPAYSLDRLSRRILKQADGSSNKNTAMLLSVISQLWSVNPASASASIVVSDLHISFIDKWKYGVERLSGVTWNWWPLQKPIYPLRPGHVYLLWQCRCGAHRRAQVPVWVSNNLIRVSNMFQSSSKSTLPTHAQKFSLQQISSRSDTHSFQQGSNRAARGSSGAANNTPPKMTGYVFFGVKCGGEHSVAEINVHGLGDDQFFNELRAEYYKMKGYLKRFFSIWRFTHCDFVKFEKFDYGCSVPRGESLPENDPDYRYVPKPRKPSDPMPPIDPHEFETRFYSCYGGGQRHKHVIFSCNSEVCRSDDDALERIPKRIKALTVGIPKRGYFWGLYARENISFLMVALYNFLLLGSPFVFWMCWLFVWNHPGDLQNASIPTAVVAAILPMFWLHLFTNKEHHR